MMFTKLNSAITKVAGAISIFTLILLTITLFIGVLTRYVFSYSIPEIEIIRKFSIMWLVFMGSAVAVKDKLHLEIDIFSEYLSENMNKVKDFVVYILQLSGILILLFIGIAAFKSGLIRTELISIRFLSNPPSLTYYYSAFLVGSIFMLYFHIIHARDLLVRREVKKK